MTDSSTIESGADCPGFEGNSDLYGLGIRIGVYLQWYSTWLCITVDPETSGETHTANALFIFAILVALLQAISNQSINKIEAYLMLQICFGYLLTLLSVFGIRLQLLRPDRAQRITSTFLSLFNRKRKDWRQSMTLLVRTMNDDLESATSIGMVPSMIKIFMLSGLRGQEVTLRLSELNSLKEGSLSWIGSFWRVSIATIIALTNVILVFNVIEPLLPTDGLCGGNGFIFMFAKCQLSGSCLTFLRVVAVAVAVVFGLLAFIIVTTSHRLFLFLDALAASDIVLLFFNTAIPAKFHPQILAYADKLRRIWRELFSLGGWNIGYLQLTISILSPLTYSMVLLCNAILEALKSMSDSTSTYRPGQTFALYAMFASGARSGRTTRVVAEKEKEKTKSVFRWHMIFEIYN